MEKEEIKTLVQEIVKETIEMNRPTALSVSNHFSFNIQQIDNGYVTECWNDGVSHRVFSETRSKALELAAEFLK